MNCVYAIQTRAICKKFSSESIVHNLNLNIRAKSVYGLLGPNGSGKSTTLKMILGMLATDSGEVLIGGETLKVNRYACLRKIGAVIENLAIYEHLSAERNLRIVSHLLQVDTQEIDRVLEVVDLWPQRKKKAGQFSFGMKQRLAIACALLGSPSILVLDEPTNGLDPIGVRDLKSMIRSFPDMGISVLLTSHVLADVDAICDDVGLICKGKLVYEGCVDGLKKRILSTLEIDVSDPARAKMALGQKYRISDSQERGKLTIEGVNRGDIPILNRKLVRENIDVYRLALGQQSLEDAFIQAVSE